MTTTTENAESLEAAIRSADRELHATEVSLTVLCRLGERPPVTMQFLMEDHIAHMRHHLARIAEQALRQ